MTIKSTALAILLGASLSCLACLPAAIYLEVDPIYLLFAAAAAVVIAAVCIVLLDGD